MMRRAAMQSRKELSLDMLKETNGLGMQIKIRACAGEIVLYGREIGMAGYRRSRGSGARKSVYRFVA
jgi:hypothetical protein